jgi:AcrR family transcriptional regulator
MSEMSKTKEKLIEAAITYLNSEGKAKMNVKKLIKIANVGYGTFYNHFDSIEDIQYEALSKTVKDMLIDFKLNVINEKDYVYIIYLALLRALNLLSNSPSINWLLDDIQMVVQVFKEISQPNMENTFLNAVKAKQIQNTDIEDLIDFRLSRHYVQWAAMGAIQQIVDGELSEKEAFKELTKNVVIVNIPNEQRNVIVERILNEKHPWEITDNVGK